MRSSIKLFGRRFNMAPQVNRRRLVVVFYGVYAILQFLALNHGNIIFNGFIVTVIYSVLIGPILGGYSSQSVSVIGEAGLVEPFNGATVLKYPKKRKGSYFSSLFHPIVDTDPGLKIDERSIRRFNEAKARGFGILGVIFMAIFLVEWFSGESSHGYNVLGIPMPAAMANQIVLYLIQIGFLFTSTLPQAILLWTEPDMEAEAEAPTE